MFTTGALNGTDVLDQYNISSGMALTVLDRPRERIPRTRGRHVVLRIVLQDSKNILSQKLNSIEGISLTRFGLFGSSVRINGRPPAKSCIPVYSSYDKKYFTMTSVRNFQLFNRNFCQVLLCKFFAYAVQCPSGI